MHFYSNPRGFTAKEGCGFRQVGGPGERIPRRNLVVVHPDLTFGRVILCQTFMCPGRVDINTSGMHMVWCQAQ